MDTEPEKSKSLEYGLGIFILLGSIAAIFIWMEAKNRHRAASHEHRQTVNNARQVGFALFEFETEHGSFPNDATAADITKHHPAHGYDLSGTSSNALFRQLFAVEITQSEQMFFAKIPGTIRPDGRIAAPGEALKKGECGFSYVTGMASAGDPARPTVLTPLIPGTTKFDPKPFDGRAIIIRIDNSVRSYDIHKDGHVYDKGINLLSAKHPVWNGKAPDIRYPE